MRGGLRNSPRLLANVVEGTADSDQHIEVAEVSDLLGCQYLPPGSQATEDILNIAAARYHGLVEMPLFGSNSSSAVRIAFHHVHFKLECAISCEVGTHMGTLNRLAVPCVQR